MLTNFSSFMNNSKICWSAEILLFLPGGLKRIFTGLKALLVFSVWMKAS